MLGKVKLHLHKLRIHDDGGFEGVHCGKIVTEKVKLHLHKIRIHGSRGE